MLCFHKPDPYLHFARAYAVRQISDGLRATLREGLALHGPDPQSRTITIAAFALAIDEISKDDPDFKGDLARELRS
jgi:hypothetical protein